MQPPHTTAHVPPIAAHWPLEPGLVFLNHGSFGSAPRAVLDEQTRLRAHLESDPMRFFVRELEPRLDAVREVLGRFVNADPAGIAFVPNATTGVNAALRSFALGPGDEILLTSHGYNACNNAARDVAQRTGATVTVVTIPFPLEEPADVMAAIERALTPRTRVALIDHVTSPTGLVLPVRDLVRLLSVRGVETVVDGAHAIGMVPLDLRMLGAAFYTSNCHKWLCTPKGSAFLYAREDLRGTVRPTVISHGANDPRAATRGRYRVEFDWPGTVDPTPYLCVPYAIELLGSLVPGGWPALMECNRALALRARDILCRALDVRAPAPDAMIGALAAVPIAPSPRPRTPGFFGDALQDELYEKHRIVVPVTSLNEPRHRLVRVSAQLYNHESHYELLAKALVEGLAREQS